jgi:membrane fusion protein (multidrug efflux system)
MRIGQPVKLTADAYGSGVEYHGTVAGLGVGTGAAFALLPAQNATGNWIKVVQRLPVRIELAPKELAAHPLRVGLSMEVDVDVANEKGATLAASPRGNPSYTTTAFTHDAEEADALVKETIAANIGPAGATPAVAAAAAARARHPASRAAAPARGGRAAPVAKRPHPGGTAAARL